MSFSVHLLLWSLVPACTSQYALSALPREFSTGSPEEVARAVVLATPSLKALAAKHGIADYHELVVGRAFVDRIDTAHVHVRHYLDGLPVFGAEAIVHLDPWGRVT